MFARNLRTVTTVVPRNQLQPTHEIESRFLWVCEGVGCTRQQSLEGSQKQLMRHFRQLEVGSQRQHWIVAELEKIIFSHAGAY